MRERDIEAFGVKAIERCGGTCEKFTSPGRRSVPDRICSLRRGVVFFIEFKAPGEKPTPAQERDHARRRARGFRVYVVDNKMALLGNNGIIARELGGLTCTS